jgi:hypothetical protein
MSSRNEKPGAVAAVRIDEGVPEAKDILCRDASGIQHGDIVTESK